MRDDGVLDDDDVAAIQRDVGDEIAAAVEAAEQAPEEPVSTLLEHVMSEGGRA